MKKITIIILIIFTNKLFGNPIESFIKNYPFNNKKILITVNIEDCLGCNIPLDYLVEQILAKDKYIPIYLIINDSLNLKAKDSYLKKLNIKKNDVNLISDEKLYKYLLGKTKNHRNITVINGSKIDFIQAINNELSIDKITSYFAESIKLKVTELYKIENEFTDFSKNFNGLIFNNNNFIIFKKGINIISSYSIKTGNSKSIQLDSLPVFNINYFKNIIPDSDFLNSQATYNSKNGISDFISPISIFKISENYFGVNCYLKTFESGTLKNDSVLFESETCFVIVLDTNLKYQNILKFEEKYSKDMIFECKSVCYDSIIYYVGSDSINKYYIGEFQITDKKLILNNKTKFYFIKKKNEFMPIISGVNNFNKNILITSNAHDYKKSKVFNKNYLNNYEFWYTINKIFIYGSYLFQTKNNNLIYVGKKDNKIIVTHNTNNPIKLLSEEIFYFVYNGKLYSINYMEN